MAWHDKLSKKFQTRRTNKYGAKKTSSLDGAHSFASKFEAELYAQLKLQERAGFLKDIKIQDHVYLTNARVDYIADFRTTDTKTGLFVWHESKGVETAVWRIKRRLWMHYGPGTLIVYKKSGNRIVEHEVLAAKPPQE